MCITKLQIDQSETDLYLGALHHVEDNFDKYTRECNNHACLLRAPPTVFASQWCVRSHIKYSNIGTSSGKNLSHVSFPFPTIPKNKSTSHLYVPFVLLNFKLTNSLHDNYYLNFAWMFLTTEAIVYELVLSEGNGWGEGSRNWGKERGN